MRRPLSTDKKIAEEKLAEMVSVRRSAKYHHSHTRDVRLDPHAPLATASLITVKPPYSREALF